MRALGSNKNHTKCPRKWKCRRFVVEPWVWRERARGSAEWGKAESGWVVALGHLGQHQAGPLAGRGRPWILPSCGPFCVNRNEEMAQHGYENCGIFKHILQIKTDTTCLPNMDCRCCLVCNWHQKTNCEAFREWEAIWCWGHFADPVFRPCNNMVHRHPASLLPTW